MHTTPSDSKSVDCELIGDSSRPFHILLYNVQGLNPEKVNLLQKLICPFELVALTETHVPHATFGFPGGWSVFAAPRILQSASGERHGGVALLLRGAALTRLVRRLGEADRVPPETVAVELEGSLFQIESNVIVIVSYVTRPGKIYNAYISKYGKSILSMLSDFIIYWRLQGFEVLICGDFNAYTQDSVGWTGTRGECVYGDSKFENRDEEFRRLSDCKQTIDGNGRELLQLCIDGELRILNGLRSSQRALKLDYSVTRISEQGKSSEQQAGSRFSLVRKRVKELLKTVTQTIGLDSLSQRWLAPSSAERHEGSVLDYFAASSGLLQDCGTLVVLARDEALSDHCPVRYSCDKTAFPSVELENEKMHREEFQWPKISAGSEKDRKEKTSTASLQSRSGKSGATNLPSTASGSGRSSGLVPSRPYGWRFRGRSSNFEADADAATIEISKNPKKKDILPVLNSRGATEAYRLIHSIARESWALAGVESSLTTGARQGPREGRTDQEQDGSEPSVNCWFDEELRIALEAYRKLHRIKKPNPETRKIIRAARSRFKKLMKEKKRQWNLRNTAFFNDISDVNHTNVWNTIRAFLGKCKGECRVSAEEQRRQYAEIGQPRHHPDFDQGALLRARAWLAAFLEQRRGIAENVEQVFSEEEIAGAFRNLKVSAAGIDGLNKSYAVPIANQMLTEVTALFSYIYCTGICVKDWSLSIVVSIKKKGISLTDMDNFRGVHVLQFFRQWYAKALQPKLDTLCEHLVAEEQQGFREGGRIYASFLALYAIIEGCRIRKERLYIAFVDVRKAFPSVSRELLFQKLSQKGAPDSLVRALWALYDNAQGTVRGAQGFGVPFDIEVGTREGGVESPLLFILFVCDLIGNFDAIDFDGEEVMLAGSPIRALQLADDLAIFAKNPQDLDKLILAWEEYCDRNHIETQIKKTEILPVTWESDEELIIKNGALWERCAPRRLNEDLLFSYKGVGLRTVETFKYLGVLFGWKRSAEEAWADREGTALKALGALMGTLYLAPHLPITRLTVVAFAIVGGTYRYGSELWGPYIPASGSRVSTRVSRWITGFGNTKLERCRGWTVLRELDTEAQASSLRAVQDACERGGLLGRAVQQLHENWTAAGRSAGSTWMGRLVKNTRKVWPEFRVSCHPLAIEGTPALCSSRPIAKVFIDDTWIRLWKERQGALLQSPPTDKQQDFVLHAILRNLNQNTQDKISDPIFPFVPDVEANAFQSLLRFLAGMEDFARVHSQHCRIDKKFCTYTVLRDFSERRYCLFCWHYKHWEHLDSEWHSLFACPYIEKVRRKFRLALESSGLGVTLPSDWDLRFNAEGRAPNVHDLAEFVAQCRMHKSLVIELARFVADLLHRRERLYRFCTARGNSYFPKPWETV